MDTRVEIRRGENLTYFDLQGRPARGVGIETLPNSGPSSEYDGHGQLQHPLDGMPRMQAAREKQASREVTQMTRRRYRNQSGVRPVRWTNGKTRRRTAAGSSL